MELNNLRNNRFFSWIAIIGLFLLQTSPVLALPQGEEIVAGYASFDRAVPNALTVNTSSERLIVNYDSFSIAQPESVSFIQPSSSAVALNRVVGGDPSAILGKLSANGRVFVVNPNGILFGANSHVDTAGLVASTLGISNQDFLAGNYQFTQNGSGAYIVNQGQINIINGGYAVLLSNAISNVGSIVANLGKIVLAAGEKITVGLDDANDIAVTIDEAVKDKIFGPDGQVMKGAIDNNGVITADGGKVVLTAKTLNNVFDYAVNNAGVIEAKSLVSRNGVIELLGDGGSVIASSGSLLSTKAGEAHAEGGQVILKSTKNAIVYSGATIDVSGGLIGGDAGFIEVSGEQRVGLYSTKLYTNAAANFKRGVVLIDPRDIIIATAGVDAPTGNNASPTADELYTDHAGVDLTIDPLTLAALSASEVYLQATRDIFINNNLTLNTALKLEAGNDIAVNANIVTNGQSIILSADADSSAAGTVSMAAGKSITSNGGAITLNSATALALRDINAGAGTITLNPLAGGASQLEGALIAANLLLTGAGSFALTAANNDVNTLAANVNGALTFTDVDDLSIGQVGATSGLRSTNNNITLNTGAALSLSKNVNAGTAIVTLNPTAGGVNQPVISNSISITGSGLLLTGAGSFNLRSANLVGTLAANINGSLVYRDFDGLTVGSVGGVDGITSAGNNVSLKSASNAGVGGMVLTKDINAGAGTISLLSTFGLTQTGGKLIAANLLLPSGAAGGATLTSATNDVDTIAMFGSGVFSFTDVDDVKIGSVTGTDAGTGLAVTSTGISTNQNALTVNAGGLLTVDNAISTGSADTKLTAAGVTQNSGAISANGLMLSGAGVFALNVATNNIATLAVNTSAGAVSYRDSNAMAIGSVGGINGVTTSNQNFSLNSGALTISQAVNAGTATVDLSVAGVTQTAAITADKLGLSGTGTFTLTNASNNVATLAANPTGAVRYTDSNALTVGTVGAINGISTNDDVTINSGALTISQAINTGSGNLELNVAGVTQTASITTEELGLNGTGTFTLNHASNNAVSLAANTVGALSYTDSNALTISSVNLTNGVTTANNDFTLNSGALTISQVINAGAGTVSLTAAGATQTAAITADKLSLSGTGTFTLTNAANDLSTLAANVSGALSVKDANSLAVGTVGALSGLVSGDNTITLTADDLNLSNAVNAGTAGVTLVQTTNGRAINLGTNTAGSLGLTDTEIDNITAAQVSIGNSNSGAITISDNVSPANTQNLSLITGAGIEGAAGKTLTVATLTANAATGIGVTNALNTSGTSLSLSATNGNLRLNNSSAAATTVNSVSTGSGDITFAQSGGGALTVTTAATTSGAVSLSNAGANLTAVSVTADGSAKNISVTTTASGNLLVGALTAAGDTITLNAAGSIEESGSDVAADLTAGTLSLTALNGIGALGILETAASSVSAATTSSNIDISNNNALATTVSLLSAGAGNVVFAQSGGGDLTLGSLAANGSATVTSSAAIKDDSTQATRLTAGTVNLTAATAIGSSSNGDMDTDANFINASAANDIYLNENNALELTSMTSTAGLVSLVTGGALSLKAATARNGITLRAVTGDVTFDGVVESTNGAVNVQADAGSILAVGNITHLKARADSLLSVPNGTITSSGQELKVDVTGNLILDIGGAGITSGVLTGTITGSSIPLILPSNNTPPVRPAGNINFNGTRIWPTVSAFAVSQASNVLINRFSFPAADQIAGSQVVSFNPPGPVFLYHPLTQLDSAAFDQEFQLDEGAYDFLDGRIEEKKKESSEN